MKRLAPALFVVAAWAAFGSWAEAHRASQQTDPSASGPASRPIWPFAIAPDLRIDTERFRAFAHANHLNHADFFTLKRSVAPAAGHQCRGQALREKPQEACAALWDRYGSAGSVAQPSPNAEDTADPPHWRHKRSREPWP